MEVEAGHDTGDHAVNGAPAKERKSRSGWIAAGLALALLAWMGSGFIIPSASEPDPVRTAAAERPPVAVEVVASKARPVTDYLVSDGQAIPDRVTVLRAEASGNVDTVLVAKGARVEEGQLIATIEADDRAAQQASAQAELARAKRDFDAVQSLFDRGYATRTRLDEARVAVTAADSGVAQATRGQSDTNITAPFAGVLDALSLEPGQVITAGAEIGTLVDADPLKIEIRVPQQAVRSIRPGKSADITFITGETREGRVTYVSTNANQATRTFTAEVVVENTNGIPAGISAQVRIPTSEAEAHFVSPATLSLSADGTLGIKTVGDDDKVGFFAVDVVRAETKGVWVAGLPDDVSIITVGQGFVDEGETVVATVREASQIPEPEPTAKPEVETEPAAKTPVAPQEVAPASDPPRETVTVAKSAVPAPEAEAPPAQRKQNEPPAADPAFATEREIEDTLAATRTVQQQLNELGYDVGKPDGIMGSRTVAGIRNFQRDLKVDADGQITFDLMDALSKAIRTDGASEDRS